MTDEEFYKLHCEIEGVYLKLHFLQDKYRKETGRDFIPGQGFHPRQQKKEKGEREQGRG